MYEAAPRIGAGKVLNTKVLLFNSGFDDILIRQRSGYRSDAINVYKPPSCNMLQSLSNTLQPPKPKRSTSSCTNTKKM